MRELLRNHLSAKERRAFESEARRQSLAIAERARDPATDEARVMGEIDSALEDDDLADAWTA
ncbi:MAG: hypothetical protein ACYC8V_14220 [Caulobacteraceae bacterium]